MLLDYWLSSLSAYSILGIIGKCLVGDDASASASARVRILSTRERVRNEPEIRS